MRKMGAFFLKHKRPHADLPPRHLPLKSHPPPPLPPTPIRPLPPAPSGRGALWGGKSLPFDLCGACADAARTLKFIMRLKPLFISA